MPLIDVREDDEYAEARVPGAVHIPLGEVPDRVAEVPSGETVYVICAKGGRSAKAVEHLPRAGHRRRQRRGRHPRRGSTPGFPTDHGPGSA